MFLVFFTIPDGIVTVVLTPGLQTRLMLSCLPMAFALLTVPEVA